MAENNTKIQEKLNKLLHKAASKNNTTIMLTKLDEVLYGNVPEEISDDLRDFLDLYDIISLLRGSTQSKAGTSLIRARMGLRRSSGKQ